MFAVDIISAIEFDRTGDHLATGDRGGRVVLFERTDAKDVSWLTQLFKGMGADQCFLFIYFQPYLFLPHWFDLVLLPLYELINIAWWTSERSGENGLFHQ